MPPCPCTVYTVGADTQQGHAIVQILSCHIADLPALIGCACQPGSELLDGLAALPPALALCAGVGAGGPELLDGVAALHVAAVGLAAQAHRKPPTLADLTAWLRLARVMVQRGHGPSHALVTGMELVRADFFNACVRGLVSATFTFCGALYLVFVSSFCNTSAWVPCQGHLPF